MERIGPKYRDGLEHFIEQNPNLVYPQQAKDYLQKFTQDKTDGITCWRAKSVQRKAGSQIEGVGLFATEPIDAKVVVAIKPGHLVGRTTIKENAHIIKGSHQQIGTNAFVTGLTPEEVEKNLVGYNHSCDPNAKVMTDKHLPLAFLVIKRPVEKGEEITTDYSVSQCSNTHRIFMCKCGSQNCREVIMPGYDWRDEEFQKEHMDEFPDFMRNEINLLDQYSEPAKQGELRLRLFLMSADILSCLKSNDPKMPKPQTKRGKQLEKLLVDEFIRQFVKFCPFTGNLDKMGVDQNNPDSIKKNKKKIIAFPKTIDHLFSA